MSRIVFCVLMMQSLFGQAEAMDNALLTSKKVQKYNDTIDELLRKANEEGDELALDCYMIAGDLERGIKTVITPDQPEYQRLVAEGLITPEGRLEKVVAEAFWIARDQEILLSLARKLVAFKKKISNARYLLGQLYQQAHCSNDFESASCINSIKNLCNGHVTRINKSDINFDRLGKRRIITAEGRLKKHVAIAFIRMSKFKKQ